MTDEQWVVRALKSPDDFFCLVVKYEPILKKYIRRISGVSEEVAQDIAQDVFIKAYRNLNDFDTDLKFSSWIYRITHNHTLNEVAKNRKFVFGPNEDFLNKFAKDLVEESSSDSAVDFEIFNQKALGGCLESLPENQKAVILLYFWEDKSYEEISDILHFPIGTVGTYLNRAKVKIKACLEKAL